MYEIPKAKSGVYFTKNLTEANYKAGIDLLGWFYRNSVLQKPPYYPATSFDNMVLYLRQNYPTFIESLGENVKTIDRDKLIQAMKNLGAKNQTSFPRPANFSNEIFKVAGVSTSEVLRETASEIGDSLVTGSRVLLILMVLGGLIVGYLYVRPFLPKELKGSA